MIQFDRLLKIANLIRDQLTDDLLKKDWLKKKPENSPNSFGHCYIASEALYYMGGKEYGLKPYILKINGGTHWFLRNKAEFIDPTWDQFSFYLDYESAKGAAFLTKYPSKRTKILIERVLNVI